MTNRRTHKIIAGALASMQSRFDAAGVTADIEEDWLTLSSPFVQGIIHGQAIPRCAWELLERNAGAVGSAKVIITTGDQPAVRAIAEISTDSPQTLGPRLPAAMDDLSAVLSPDGVDPVAHDAASPYAETLEELCAEAGWPFHRRGDGRLAIALDVPQSAATALVGPTIRVELAPADVESDVIRQAVGVFLLQLGGVVRLVRAALCHAGDRATLELQSPLGPDPTGIELNHALCALSVACRAGQREVALLLSNESLCTRYLAVCGWSASAEATPQVS